MNQCQGLSEVNLGGECKIGIIFFEKFQLQPNLICRCSMFCGLFLSAWVGLSQT